MSLHQKFLIIQTAFIGDVILATPIIENLKNNYPNSEIHFCLRKGNESLFHDHPYLAKIIIWDKSSKYKNLFSLIKSIRKEQYDHVFCVQRFFSAGLITWLSGAKQKTGFNKSPFSRFFNSKIEHSIGNDSHETERNTALVSKICSNTSNQPKLYLNDEVRQNITDYISPYYICIAPASVWFTKQFPVDKWTELLNAIAVEHPHAKTYIVGAPSDKTIANNIIQKSNNKHLVSLCGRLSLLESAALMSHAKMNFVNDSAPMHLASAVDAPVCAIYCSTIPSFGFGPLSKDSHIVQIAGNPAQQLNCRPCGLHGHQACPKQHFKCAHDIDIQHLLQTLPI